MIITCFCFSSVSIANHLTPALCLNRRASDHNAVRGANLANLLRQLNARILDAVALVENDVVPGAINITIAARHGRMQPLGARGDQPIRGQQHAAALPDDIERVISRACRCAVKAAHAHRRAAPLGELALPAGQHCRISCADEPQTFGRF